MSEQADNKELPIGEVRWDIEEIQTVLAHRYPFLLIDRVIQFVDNEKIVAIKNVTANEQFFNGHFPSRKVMPGVLVLEAMAQTAAILAIRSSDGVRPGYLVYLTGANDVRWKRPVVPGDQMRIEMTSFRKRRPFWVMNGVVTVDGNVVASGQLQAAEIA